MKYYESSTDHLRVTQTVIVMCLQAREIVQQVKQFVLHQLTNRDTERRQRACQMLTARQ